MIKISDNEGEMLVTLTDVTNKADLDSRLAKEDQELMNLLYDTPLFADVVGPESMYDQTEEDYEGCDTETMTYAEWIKGCLDWAREYSKE